MTFSSPPMTRPRRLCSLHEKRTDRRSFHLSDRRPKVSAIERLNDQRASWLARHNRVSVSSRVKTLAGLNWLNG